ncbi:hypothetical protein AB833_22710 [Chromatiales bacterium (ex Bugula neritina AB1)]|nr:hypothetical protein AB833_22710 [Chromatiales bacterium (ex Bugula neritina AB1)]
MHDTDSILLHNSQLNVAISPVGAELQSMKSVASAEEFLWHGDPAWWAGQAPILFPIVGSLKNNTMSVDARDYEMARHGLVRGKLFNLLNHSSDSCLFSTSADASTLLNYPWQFELRVNFSLHNNRIDIGYEVINNDSTTMIFTLGSHPAFSLPGTIAEYAIRFNQPETLQRFHLDDSGLLAIHGTDYMKNTTRVELHKNLFDEDALVFKNIKSGTVDLLHGENVRVSVDTGGAPHLGLWAKPGAPFVCIEPWFGYSDNVDSDGNFKNKPAMIHLPAGDSFSNTWSITISP